MGDIEKLIPPIAQMLGLDPATLLLLVGVIVAVGNLLGRLIPDDATGVLGIVRKISKFVGLYASNRVSSGLSVNQVARQVLPEVEEVNRKVDSVVRTVSIARSGFGKQKKG